MIKRYSFTVSSDFIGPRQTENGGFVDYKDYAALQQKLDALADKLARSEDYSVGVDAERMEYIKKCNALAAENAALKQVAMDYADLADSRLSEMTANCESDCRRECYEFTNKIPATDAYLNSVRADAIESVVDALASYGALTVGDCIVEVVKLAESLRSGTHDTADKAG